MERIEGLRKRIFEAGMIPRLLSYGQQGLIAPFHIINRDELVFGPEVAKGSGGTVYRGQWNGRLVCTPLRSAVNSQDSKREVAIKVCGKLGLFNDGVESFRFEVALMSLIEHPNILQCLGANETDQEPFLVMPIRGKSTFLAPLSLTNLFVQSLVA